MIDSDKIDLYRDLRSRDIEARLRCLMLNILHHFRMDNFWKENEIKLYDAGKYPNGVGQSFLMFKADEKLSPIKDLLLIQNFITLQYFDVDGVQTKVNIFIHEKNDTIGIICSYSDLDYKEHVSKEKELDILKGHKKHQLHTFDFLFDFCSKLGIPVDTSDLALTVQKLLGASEEQEKEDLQRVFR